MPPEYNPEDEEPQGWPVLPSTLWNHHAMAIDSVPNDHLFVFGGQKSPREFSNLVSVMECVHHFETDYSGENPVEIHTLKLTWVESPKWTLNGTPPPAREDAGCSYDLTTCSMVFFGGWRQKWFNDICMLNVAGVVGPPYAVSGVSPVTGPLTGLTPITIYGQSFKESPLVSVRFTDGKKSEATVSGSWVSSTEIQCKSPDFSK